jgi:hypothetical protein
MKRYNR